MLSEFFPDSDDMPLEALVFMLAVYAFVLCKASGLISDGSEMLLLLYGPGIVGGLVLPLLGAIPDAAVILISGLAGGTPAEVNAQIAVGVGTLVGSTIFILTLPYLAGVYLGRRDYDIATGQAGLTALNRPKLTHFSLTTNCVTVLPDIPHSSVIMMVASGTYVLVQVPVWVFSGDADGGTKRDRPWLLVATLVSAVSFLLYCASQMYSASAVDMDRRKQESLRREQWKLTLDRRLGESEYQEMVFREFDKDNSGFIDAAELSGALASLGLKVDRRDLQDIMKSIDVGNEGDEGGKDAGAGDGRVSLNEFKAAVSLWVSVGQRSDTVHKIAEKRDAHAARADEEKATVATPLKQTGPPAPLTRAPSHSPTPGHHDEEEFEDEEEFLEYTDAQLNLQAMGLLLLGTAIVTVFTEPMIDCLTNAGDRLHVSPFYLAFAVVPLISNASELIAGLMFAKKKTNESISMTLSTFLGTATINATLCLFLFLCIVYSQQLAWHFSAEIIAVLVVVGVVGVCSMGKNIFMWQAVVCGAMYPTAICIVYTLENAFGLD